MSASAVVGRREFIRTGAAIGGGLLVSLHVPLAGGTGDALAAEEKDFALNAFVRIGTDESVTVISAHSEMGQGIYTSLPMLLNEELQADWSKIRVEPAPVDKVYNHPVFGMQITGGSTTSPAEWVRYRKMGAVARTMLVEAATRQWNVEASSCHVEKGVVIHDTTGRRATYGSLANAAAQLTGPADVPLKDAKEFTLIGKPTRRLDTPSKTDGSAQFGLDVSVPGMLTAVVARPPVFGGKVAKFDASKALRVPGVKAVEGVASGVAVIAERFWPAKIGRDKLTVEWDLGPNAGLSTEQMLRDFR
jgi:isoquinoline 1-oxidoreductase subunit beta